MKKLIISLIFVVGIVSVLSAQLDKKAIGVRFGGFSGYGAEVSYQQPLGANRVEFDLGLNGWGFGLNGLFQWVKPLPQLYEGFNWYWGVGAGLGLYNFNSAGTAFGLGVLGQIGLEYNFEFPLQLSIDYRPGLYVMPSIYPTYDGICLSARYRL